MLKKLSTIPFVGTAEQDAQLAQVIEKYKGDKSRLMAVMQEAQGIYGYLPIEVQTKIAEALKVSLEEVFGVATFYSQFTLSPRGQYQVSVCMGTACYVKGAGDLVDALKAKFGIESGECTDDGKFSLIETRCIGCCGLAPVMTVNSNVYGKVTTNQLDGIISEYK